jgi:hypothetical protein
LHPRFRQALRCVHPACHRQRHAGRKIVNILGAAVFRESICQLRKFVGAFWRKIFAQNDAAQHDI